MYRMKSISTLSTYDNLEYPLQSDSQTLEPKKNARPSLCSENPEDRVDFKPCTSHKRPVTSKNEFLALLLNEVKRATVGSGKPRHLGRFFNIVRGGNVAIVTDVIQSLKALGLTKELCWVLGDKTASAGRIHQSSGLLCILHWFMLVFWTIIFFLLTPVFYLLQILVHNVHLITRSRISEHITLPLVFAVMSEDPAMVQLFLQEGCPLFGQDSGGNNLYHYLSDLSIDDHDKAVRCHRIICSCVDDEFLLKSLITEQTNHLGITGLESIAKYGSPHFLHYILVDKSCVGALLLGVSKNHLWVNDQNQTCDFCDAQPTPPGGNDNLNMEGGTLSLNIWEFDISMYEKGDVFGKQSFLLQLISSRSVEGMPEAGVWGLIRSKLIDKWFSAKFKSYGTFAVVGHVVYLLITILLLTFVVMHESDLHHFPLHETFIDYEYTQLSQAGHPYANSTGNTNSRRPNTSSAVSDTCHQWNITWQHEILDLIKSSNSLVKVDNCTATALETLTDACQALDIDYIFSQTLNHTERTIEMCPIRKFLDYIILSHVILDNVIRLGFLWSTYNLEASSLHLGILPVLLRRYPGSYTEKVVSYLMYIVYGVFLYSNDLWTKAIASRDQQFENMLQNMDHYTVDEHARSAKSLKEEVDKVKFLSEVTENLVVMCLMLRFLHSIHALRLLPGVGFFVITTRKMAKHLLQFTVVYSIVSLSFATIFYFVMRDAICPALKAGGFQTLSGSVFSAYQVALGHGKFDFTNNVNAMIAYVAYTIFTLLLLLNLVISVMTTTVDELNQMPWKQALCCIERWDEILCTEVAVRTMAFPVTCWGRGMGAPRGQTHSRPMSNTKYIPKRKAFEISYFE